MFGKHDERRNVHSSSVMCLLRWITVWLFAGEIEMSKQLARVLAGSRLHNLHNEDSDYDWRGIHIHSLKERLSPFRKLKNTDWIEGDEDNTSFELSDFCKMATRGNATILEVFFSDKIEKTSEAHQALRDNWEKFIDTHAFIMASRGYAHNQLNKMHLYENKGIKGQDRTPKFAVSYCRVLWQCATFLEDGEFHPAVDEPEWNEYLRNVKYNFEDISIPELTQKFTDLQVRITVAESKAKIMKPDIDWIEDFIYQTYKNET